MTIKKADYVADRILSLLNNRKGFDWWWDELDDEIQEEIRASIAWAIYDNMVQR